MADYQLFGVIFVVLGLGIVVGVAMSRLRAISNWLDGTTADAVVVSSRMIFWGGDYRGYWANVEFTDYYGLHASAKVETPTKPSQGDRISIVYNPDKPKRAALSSDVQEMRLERGPWRLPWWVWLVSVLVFVTGLFLMAGVGWS